MSANQLPRVTTGAISVRQELRLLGLTPEILTDAIAFGEAYRALCTDDDPRIYHGLTAWARTLRGLRSDARLRRDGWMTERAGGFETVVNPDRSLAVYPTTGDSESGRYNTARPWIQPRLKHPKGIMTQEAVDMNGWLFPDMAADAERRADALRAAEERATWMLLMHREGDTVYAELSLPSQFSSGQVTHWNHRIILEPFDVEPQPSVVDDSDDSSGDVVVEVRRRS